MKNLIKRFKNMEREEAIKRLAEIKSKIIALDDEIDKMMAEIDSEEENEKDKRIIRRIVRDFLLNVYDGIEESVEIGKKQQIELYRKLEKKFKYIKGRKITVYRAMQYANIEFEYLKELNDGWRIIKITIPEEE